MRSVGRRRLDDEDELEALSDAAVAERPATGAADLTGASPASRAAMLGRLQRGAGNASVSAMLAREVATAPPDALDEQAAREVDSDGTPEVEPHAGGDASDGQRAAEDAKRERDEDTDEAPELSDEPGEQTADAPAAALGPIEIGQSVGKGGKNRDADVKVVSARLQALGFPAGADLDALIAAIKSYQADALGWQRQDGRVDPGGKTLRALGAGKTAAAAKEEPAKEAPAKQAEAKPDAAPKPGGDAKAPAKPADASIAAWVDENPTDNPSMAKWLLVAHEHKFVEFNKKKSLWQIVDFAEGKKVIEADGAADAKPVTGLQVVMSIVRARAKRWLQDPSKPKNQLKVGSLVRDDRSFGFEGHTKGRSADLSGGYDFDGDKGPAQVMQTLDDLGPGTYGIGLPFQGQFFPPEAEWVERAKKQRAAVGKDGTPAPVTEPSLKRYYSAQFTADWAPDRKNGWKTHEIKGKRAVSMLKSSELKAKIAELNKKGYSIRVFPDNDDHIHITRM